MKSLYGEYIAAREGYEIIELASGFATYKIDGEAIYLRDMYIAPAFRMRVSAFALADMVCEEGKKAGCVKLLASVSTVDPNASKNLKIFLHYGMKLHSATPQLILFTKELYGRLD